MSFTAAYKPLCVLRRKLLRTARQFNDYNFREYFVQHIKDDFATAAKLPVADQKAFVLREGRDQLLQMKRMACINRLYAQQPVILDPRLNGVATTASSVSSARESFTSELK